MVHRLARFIAPGQDFSWLREIDNDLAFVMQPKSKLDRFVLAERLVEAGLKMVDETKQPARAKFKRARAIRNGLMLALWTLCPSRRKNFATLEIGKTFRQLNGKWWITIAAEETKTRQRPEERPVANWMNPCIELYLNEARPVLLTKSKEETSALWISDKTGSPMTTEYFSSLIPQVTKQTIGIAISPHLFRTADATTAAEAMADMPHIASGLLGHTHRRITEDHYIRASSLSAAEELASVLKQYCARKDKNHAAT
jgi:integrase/recombinase XerD